MEHVILVDENNNEIGTMEKMEAHEKGLLHRAFSIFIFNHKNELMIHRRAFHKYHSGGLWTNTCCSHPRPNEDVNNAAHRRLQEEMGFDCEMNHVFDFTYKSELDNDLTEFEYDHVFIGFYEQFPNINLDEVVEWKYMSLDAIELAIEKQPNEFTAWFKIVFEQVKDKLYVLIEK